MLFRTREKQNFQIVTYGLSGRVQVPLDPSKPKRPRLQQLLVLCVLEAPLSTIKRIYDNVQSGCVNNISFQIDVLMKEGGTSPVCRGEGYPNLNFE